MKTLHLSPEELDRIITWVDLNGVYYATYASAYPESLTGRVPLSGEQLEPAIATDGRATCSSSGILPSAGGRR